MKSIKFYALTIFLILSFNILSFSQQPIFPGKQWPSVNKPELLGYSSEKLAAAKKFSQTLKTAAVVIVVNGQILDEWGEVDKKYLTHSMRKSFLSALYGPYVDKGIINLDKTMLDLGIDDVPPLSEQEKTATIRDCLKARSCVFHTAEAESEGMHKLKPQRDLLKPGTFWLYNNWDFNVLGTIFEKLTGKDIFKALKEDIADPIGMEQFSSEDGQKDTTGRSIHPSYMFVITAKDCARFGLLMLRKGNWNGKQVIPKSWVEESTSYFSDATIYKYDGYGYMWWVAKDHNRFPHLPNVKLKEGTYSARGAGGHYVFVIPDYDMVFVHRVDTFDPQNNVSPQDVGTLLNMILESRINKKNNEAISK
jgi:CubicO group peptidase (beta-lactamase class C family)